MYRISLTWISSNTANTATGSTAAISDENRKISSTGMCLPNKLIRVHAYKEAPEINSIYKAKKGKKQVEYNTYMYSAYLDAAIIQPYTYTYTIH